MKVCFGVFLLGVLAACSVPPSQSNHQNLDVAECQRLANAVLAAGKLDYNLCPGYAPDGQKIELF